MKDLEGKCLAFAYYADGVFIGWYGDTFGSVSKTPKLYVYSEEQLDILRDNLAHKLERMNSTTFEEAKEKVSGLAALSLLTFSNEDQLRGKQVELRLVESPFYDGPNPDFDSDAYSKEVEKHNVLFKQYLFKQYLTENAKDPATLLGPTQEKFELLDKFKEENPFPKCDNWLYADYSLLKEWAANEPTEFLGVL